MDLDWLTFSNPVALWWSFLVVVSAGNLALLLWLHAQYRKAGSGRRAGAFVIEPLFLLAAAYVLGCAFRSLLPRADVQRICLFDTWLSSVMIGRSVATVAELCFVAQWAIILRALADGTQAQTARNISKVIVPLIVVAEGCSWYAVITTNCLGNVLENSLWAATFLLIAVALVRLRNEFHGIVRLAITAAAAGCAAYVVFMCAVNVPMYFGRWQVELANGTQFFGLFSGLHDAATRWIVTHDAARWDGEMIWMSLYFSLAVWASLFLGSFGLLKHRLPHYRLCRPAAKPTGAPLAVSARNLQRMP